MSGGVVRQKRIKPEFARSVVSEALATKKRPAPVSVRFSDDERKRLEMDAEGVPLGTYIKGRLFADSSGYRARSVVQDYELLAQLLAAMGRSNMFANLDVLAREAEAGNLTLSPEAEYEIGVACACVLQIRDDLIYALGLRSGSD